MKRKPIFKLNRSKNIESVLLKQQTSIFRLKKKAFSHSTYEISVFCINSHGEMVYFLELLNISCRGVRSCYIQCSHCSALTYLILGPHEITENTDSQREGRKCPDTIFYCSVSQPFWHQGLVSRKTVFPQTRAGGGWFQDDSSTVAFMLL